LNGKIQGPGSVGLFSSGYWASGDWTVAEGSYSEIKMLLEQGLSYVGLRKVIKEVYGVNVSTQILSNFAKRELGISSRKRSKKVSLSESLSSNNTVPKKLEDSDGIKYEKSGF